MANRSNTIQIRQATLDDIDEMLRVEAVAWPEGSRATREMFAARIETFPEGQRCAFVNEVMVGHVALQIICLDPEHPEFTTWMEVTDDGFIQQSHNPNGNTLYGVNLSSSGSNVGSVGIALLQAAACLGGKLGLCRGALGSRMPGYHRVADKMTANEYAFAVHKNGKPIDHEIAFMKQGFGDGFRIVRVLPNYFPCKESLDYGVLLVWEN